MLQFRDRETSIARILPLRRAESPAYAAAGEHSNSGLGSSSIPRCSSSDDPDDGEPLIVADRNRELIRCLEHPAGHTSRLA